jgi:hypothetical protein
MIRRALLAALLCCQAAACAKISPGGGKLGDPCVLSSDCADPYICVNGRCTPSSGQLCNPGDYRCNGNNVEKCSTSGDTWQVAQMCSIACVQGACVPPVCTAGQQECQDGTITECLPDGSRLVPIQTCPTSCQQSENNPMMAECMEPSCTPFETSCNAAMPGTIFTCNSNGTMLNSAPCSTDPGQPAACVNGQCEAVVCTAGSQRCDGPAAEQCNTTGTAWQTKQNGVCPNGCNFDPVSGVASCPAETCVPLTTSCADAGINVDSVVQEQCNAFGTMATPSTCAVAGGQAICVDGLCQEKICGVVKDLSGNITSRDMQCNANILQECNDSETGWQNAPQSCQYGCENLTATTAQCALAACQPGQGECLPVAGQTGAAREVCTPDQSGFAVVQYCPTGCTVTGGAPDGGQASDAGIAQASCNAPICVPLQRCCAGSCPGLDGGPADAGNVPAIFMCLADGTGYQEIETCPQTCSAGACINDGIQCTPGDLQCEGEEVQQCVRLMDGTFAWEFVERCLGTCVSGACSAGGACGCNPPVAANVEANACGGSGTAAPQPITVNILANANSPANTVPCGDGVSLSKLLVYTSPIVDESGVLVPDGTMVTFTNDSPPGFGDTLILSADADPSTPGIQRPTIDGQAVAVLAAPAQANCVTVNPTSGATTPGLRTVNVTASIGGSCAGTLAVYFAQAMGTSNGRTVYVAEDFSSTTDDDRTNTSAIWETSLDAAEAIPAYSLGTGVDGNFSVPSGMTFDLQASGYAPAWNVDAIASQSVTIDNQAASLAIGDEVLLITIWGPPGSTGPGTYEFHHVASSLNNASGFGTVSFTEPVQGLFGNGTNATLQNHRVVLQRVPQFNNVGVPSGTTLTSTAMSTGTCTSMCTPVGGTGVLAFRARGTVTVSGSITMDQAGLPENLAAYPNTAATASLNRLLEGNPVVMSGPPNSANSGGGIIFVTGGTIIFPNLPNGMPNTTSGIHSNAGTGGGAGTVWVAGGTLKFLGQTRVQATGGTTGQARIDYSASDFTSSSVPPPLAATQTTFIGEGGGAFAQSSTLYLEPASSGLAVKQALFYGLLGGSNGNGGVVTAALPPLPSMVTQLVPGVNVWVSSDGGATWAAVDNGGATFVVGPMSGQAGSGRDVRFRVELAPPSDLPLLVRGLGFSVLVH